MNLVPNRYIDMVIEILSEEVEFSEVKFNDLNNTLNSDSCVKVSKIRYEYVSSEIKKMSKDKRDTVYINAKKCMNFSIQHENDILIYVKSLEDLFEDFVELEGVNIKIEFIDKVDR